MLKQQSGFSLVGISVTLVIISIIIAFACSFNNKLIANAKINSKSKQLVQAINFARASAIKNKNFVTLCPSADKIICSDNWQEGFIVIDNNSNVLMSFSGANLDISYQGFPDKNSLQFLPNGLSLNNGTFRIIDVNHNIEHDLIINRAGRVRFKKR